MKTKRRTIKINTPFYTQEEIARKLGVSKKRFNEIKKTVEKVKEESGRQEKFIRKGLRKMNIDELGAIRDYLRNELGKLRAYAKHLNTVVDDVGLSLLLHMIRGALRNKH